MQIKAKARQAVDGSWDIEGEVVPPTAPAGPRVAEVTEGWLGSLDPAQLEADVLSSPEMDMATSYTAALLAHLRKQARGA